NGADKSQTLARQRLDQPLPFACVSDCAPGRVDPVEQCRLGNGTAVPDRREEVVLADHAIAVLDQVNKEIENLGFDSDKLRSPAQLAAIRVERTFLEQIAQYSSPFVMRRPVATVAQARQRKNGGNAETKLREPERRNARSLA